MSSRDTDLYTALFERNTSIKLIIDPQDGRIVDANPAASDFYGWDRDTMRSMKITEINILSDDEVRQRMREASSGERLEFTFPHRVASGEVRNVRVHSGPFDLEGREYLLSIIVDVTEVTELRRQFDHFFSESPEAMCVVSLEGELVSWNRAFELLVGRDSDELSGFRIVEMTHPDDLEATRREMDRRRSDGIPTTHFENRIMRPGGETRRVHWVAHWDPDVQQVFATGRDVTEVREAGRIIEEESKRLRAAERIAGFGTWTWVVGEETGTWSDSTFEIFGLTPADPEGRISFDAYFERIHPDDLPRIQASTQAMLDTQAPFNEHCRVVRPDGTIRSTISWGELIQPSNGEQASVIGVIQDVTDVEVTQATLRKVEARYQAIADSTYDWETWVDENGAIEWVNPAVERLTGHTVERCLEMDGYPLPMVVVEDRPIVAQVWRNAEQGGAGNDVPFRIVRPDGRVAWMSVSWQPLTRADGSTGGFRTSVRDINQRKLHEEERETLISELQAAEAAVKRLRGLLPICSSCKKIRDEKGNWQQMERYVTEHSEAAFSHGMCPECLKLYYPDLDLS
jgi:PAS domain S-box-containing protein